MTEREPAIVAPEQDVRRELRRRTRRDFLIGGVAAVAGIAGYKWMRHVKGSDGVPVLERRVMNFNGALSRDYLSNSHLMPSYSLSQVTYLKPNGDLGVDTPLDRSSWKLQVDTGAKTPLTLSLADVEALPTTEMVTRFCCIEGWSTITAWRGARFSDFTRKFFPPGMPLPQYVYMETPDEGYYVGLDMKSALHPQTLLAYEMNRKPLAEEHGAPLRLVIPVKYGIKNIKRIGLIQYTNTRPDDYWAEQGYDWFAGL